MITKISADRKQLFSILFISLLILYHIIRIVVFASEYGGIEHDAGWALGIARQVAERGTYTTLTSTVVNPHVQIDFNRDNQFTIQAPDGREYFFVSHSTGPGVVLPNALVLKLFGFGFWQSRLGSLIFFCLFLILGSTILYRLQGIIAVVVFQLYLFFFPQLYIFLGYDLFGEMPSMVYILTSFILFVKATQTQDRAWRWFLVSGILAGLSIGTRMPTLIVFGGYGILGGVLLWQKKAVLKDALALIGGVLLVIIFWQLVMFIGLMQVSDFTAYLNHVGGRFEFFFRSLKGITPTAEGLELFLLKALIISEVSYTNLLLSLVLGLTTAIGGVLLLRYTWTYVERRNMLLLLWLAWLIYTVWFLNSPKNAWTRYYWYGLIWLVMLLAMMFAALVKQLKTKRTLFNVIGTLYLSGLFLLSFSSQPQAMTIFITPDMIEVWRQRQLTYRDTYLPWIIVPRDEQEQVAQFIRELPPETHIYYPEGHKTAELSFLTNRIFYTLPRRDLMVPNPNDVVVMGPAIISPWKKEQQQRLDILETIHRECPAIIWETANYIICVAQ